MEFNYDKLIHLSVRHGFDEYGHVLYNEKDNKLYTISLTFNKFEDNLSYGDEIIMPEALLDKNNPDFIAHLFYEPINEEEASCYDQNDILIWINKNHESFFFKRCKE